MKKNKILAKILALVVACTGLLPNVTALAQANNQNDTGVAEVAQENENNDEVIGSGKVTTTTAPAVAIEPVVVVTPAVDLNNEIDKASQVLSIFKATNNTTEKEVVNAIKNSVDSTITVLFGVNEAQVFNKVDATLDKPGSITGTLIFNNASGKTKEISINLSISKLEAIQNNVIVRLSAKINGLDKDENLLYVGNKATVDVTGYNAEGKKVDLDLNKLSYKWFVKTEKIKYAIKGDSIVEVGKETVSNELIGENNKLEIKGEFGSDKNLDLIRTINCDVNYDDGQEGGVK